jgi:hypothetical protein
LVNEGRTNANCWAVDLFFMLGQGWEKEWGEQDLPEGFHEVLAIMSGALHDTVKAPDIAREYESLPEQILERVRKLAVDKAAPRLAESSACSAGTTGEG